MTEVSFYILGGQQQQDQWLFACRLAEQLNRKGHQVLIHTDSESSARQLDDMLWTYKEDTFVPHALLDDKPSPEHCSVHISWQNDSKHHHDALINLSDTLPRFYSRFERLVGVVIQDDFVLDYSRKQVRFLKDRGYPVEYKDMRMQ